MLHTVFVGQYGQRICGLAINSEGESAPLETTKDTLARDPFDSPDPPGQPQVVDVDANLVKFKWAKPPNDNGAPVLK